MAIKKGTPVRQVVTPIEGPVMATRFNQEHEVLEYLISYKGADGEAHQRWFLESEIAEVTP